MGLLVRGFIDLDRFAPSDDETRSVGLLPWPLGEVPLALDDRSVKLAESRSVADPSVGT